MLRLPHHCFWSELVYARRIHNCLVSYLSSVPRWYDNYLSELQQGGISKAEQAMITPVMENVHRLVLLVHMRICTYKESDRCTISPEMFGTLLYNNFILDACQLLDLMMIYEPSNSKILKKMISNVFTHQPNYNNDLKDALTEIDKALSNTSTQLGIVDETTPQALNSKSQELTAETLHACVTYLLDVCTTLHRAMRVYAPLVDMCVEAELHVKLCQMYENVVPVIGMYVSSARASEEEGAALLADALHYLMQALRVQWLAVVREVVLGGTGGASLPTTKKKNDPANNKLLEVYLHLFSSVLHEKTFIADYHLTYSIREDIGKLRKACNDTTGLDFIEEGVKLSLKEMDKKMGTCYI